MPFDPYNPQGPGHHAWPLHEWGPGVFNEQGTAAMPAYVGKAFQWYYACAYRDAQVFTDSEILMMAPEAVVGLYFDQFKVDVVDECANDTDWKNCFRWQPSSYAQGLRDAQLSAVGIPKPTFPDPTTYSRNCAIGRQCVPRVDNAPCMGGDPEGKLGSVVPFVNVRGNELAKRIYNLRSDLHEIYSPEVDAWITGLPNLAEGTREMHGCKRDRQGIEIAFMAVQAVFTAIVPYAGWIALASSVYIAIEEYTKITRLIEQQKEFMEGIPKGIAAIMARDSFAQGWLSYDEVKDLPASEEAIKLAHSMGIPHPAMVCASVETCDDSLQIVRLKGILNEWNAKRLIARRAEYDRWVRRITQQMIPGCTDTEWGRRLYNPSLGSENRLQALWNSCMYDRKSGYPFSSGSTSVHNACADAGQEWDNLVASINEKIMQGPVPPAPNTYVLPEADAYGGSMWMGETLFRAISKFDIKRAYPQSILDRTDEILTATNWFDPNHLISENLLQYVPSPIAPDAERIFNEQHPDLVTIFDLANPQNLSVQDNQSVSELTDEFSRGLLETQAEADVEPSVPWPAIIAFGLLFL